MHLLKSLLFAMAIVAPSCLGQTGTVTFYSTRVSLKDGARIGIVPVGREPFTGWLFDGNDRLAHAQPGHFMTFRFPVGPHSFFATYKSDRPGSTAIQLNIENDGHYCVRLSAKYVNYVVLPVQYVDSRIDQVSCQQAFQEAGATKPLDSKHVEANARDKLDPSPAFPNEH